MRRALHIITGLNQGGAERQLGTLVAAGADDNAVFSILPPGVMSAPIREAGIPLFSGGARNSLSPVWLPRLRAALRAYQPDVVMGWMYHGNLAASMTRLMGYRGPVLWNVRHSVDDLRQEKTATQWAIRAGARFSRGPARIVYNSATAARQHEDLGYASTKTEVIPNGFDIKRFRPNESARAFQRRALDIGEDALVLGVVGRSHPMKNHEAWLAVFDRLAEERRDIFSVIVGRGVPAALEGLLKERALQNRVFLMEGVNEPEKVYPAFDMLVLPSAWGEGFSNVVGEAMACGVPAAVTPVGDSAQIVRGTGFVTSDSTVNSLYQSVREVLSLGKGELRRRGQMARESVVCEYSQHAMVRRYEKVLKSSL